MVYDYTVIFSFVVDAHQVHIIGTQQLDFLGNCQCRLNFLDNMHIEARDVDVDVDVWSS